MFGHWCGHDLEIGARLYPWQYFLPSRRRSTLRETNCVASRANLSPPQMLYEGQYEDRYLLGCCAEQPFRQPAKRYGSHSRDTLLRINPRRFQDTHGLTCTYVLSYGGVPSGRGVPWSLA